VQAARAATLLARCSWMSRPLRNAKPVRLAELLARAPTIEDWERERAGELEPVLLNYWTIAHLLLGNLADAADAARRARQGAGEATRWLGQLAERVLAGDPSANIGRLGPTELNTLREQLRREAPAALLRP